jgi:uncharacterized protein YgbK (DUF1537 family)
MSDYFLADDLSGALDAAAAFHHAGRKVTIALSPDEWPETSADGIVGLTTETRNAVPAVAARAVTAALAQARARGGRLLYKKIDSTLRGPVEAELRALRSVMPDTPVLFTPANPAVGRTVRDGVLLVHGVPLAETEFGRDPASPARESVIRTLLGPIGLERVHIADAQSEADLVAAVAQMEATGGSWVGVGSGALARPIAARLATRPHERGAVPASPLAPGPALMVCGSAHAKNREQATMLARLRDVPVHELRMDAPSAAAGAAIADLRANRGAAILIEEQRHGDSAHVVRAIAAAAQDVLQATGVRRVFVTGGETAFALCRRLGISTLEFCAEIEAGLSVSRAEDVGGARLFAIKPGGFGDAHTWVRAWDALQHR